MSKEKQYLDSKLSKRSEENGLQMYMCLNDIYTPIVSFKLVLALLWATFDEKKINS